MEQEEKKYGEQEVQRGALQIRVLAGPGGRGSRLAGYAAVQTAWRSECFIDDKESP